MQNMQQLHQTLHPRSQAACIIDPLFLATHRYSKVPGYAGWPLLGNLLQIQESWHGIHEQGAAKYGPVFKLWYGAEPHVITASAEASKQVR